MKFDFVIGNPPYQEEYQGSSSGAVSVYDKFLNASFEICSKVEMITPARFLFNAGATPKVWNEKMLNDEHFKILYYVNDSSIIFPNVTITGGVAISYRDTTKKFGKIEVFTAFSLLNSILDKVKNNNSFVSIQSIVVTSFAYHFTQKMHFDYPEAKNILSKGHAFDLKSNCFEKLPQIFFSEQLSTEYVKMLGRANNQRAYRFIKREYINDVMNFDKYKLFFSKADGAAGTIGNPVPARIIGSSVFGYPNTGSTESFFSIGNFETEIEMLNLKKYICTKFARTMLGVLKVTQDITPSKWKYVPLQDFTAKSDIDWTKSVADIDRQLYQKYGLTQQEIDFIETKVKEMN